MPREGAGFIMFSRVSGAVPPAGAGQRLPGAGNDYPLNRADILDDAPTHLASAYKRRYYSVALRSRLMPPRALACPLRCISKGLRST